MIHRLLARLNALSRGLSTTVWPQPEKRLAKLARRTASIAVRPVALLLCVALVFCGCQSPWQTASSTGKEPHSTSPPTSASSSEPTVSASAASRPPETEAESTSATSQAASAASRSASAQTDAATEQSEPDTEPTTDLDDYTSGAHFLEEVERGIIDQINQERASVGLGELVYHAELAQAARLRSRELCESGVWAHTRPDGASWATVLENEVPVDYLEAGENLAYVCYEVRDTPLHTDAAWWFNEWKNSPNHYSNICRPGYTDIGVGLFFQEQSDGKLIAHATTLFAKME